VQQLRTVFATSHAGGAKRRDGQVSEYKVFDCKLKKQRPRFTLGSEPGLLGLIGCQKHCNQVAKTDGKRKASDQRTKPRPSYVLEVRLRLRCVAIEYVTHPAQQILLGERLLYEVGLGSQGLTTLAHVRVAGHIERFCVRTGGLQSL
jgi:hypothetical protein